MVANASSEAVGGTRVAGATSGWVGAAARGVSLLLSPPLVAMAAATIAAQQAAVSGWWRWAASYTGIAVLVPFTYLLWLLRGGRVTDIDVYRREQRLRPLAVTVLGTAIAWVALRLAAAPEALLDTALAVTVQMGIVLLITTRWKISMHVSAAAGLIVTALHVLGAAALPVVMVAPLVAWSRLYLRRHTPAQVAGGLALGVAVFTTTFALLAG